MIFLFSCTKDKVEPINYETENVIIIVMDGARYSETWGDSSHQHIPRLANDLSQMGVINTHFYNNGTTFTMPGHAALTTGHYQNLNNGGIELPQYPSIFQYWRSKYNEEQNKSWVIASKGKIEALTDCEHSHWNGTYKPSANCGIQAMGIGSGYRHDSITYQNTIDILSDNHPNLAIINFREPDFSAHNNDWSAYINGIQDVDNYIYQLIDFIENDSTYKGKTTVFVTNDHGRHSDNVADGFVSHGDDCEGCRRLLFYAYGPDFKENAVLSINREQIDIPATISELLHIDMPTGNGTVMFELFR